MVGERQGVFGRLAQQPPLLLVLGSYGIFLVGGRYLLLCIALPIPARARVGYEEAKGLPALPANNLRLGMAEFINLNLCGLVATWVTSSTDFTGEVCLWGNDR